MVVNRPNQQHFLNMHQVGAVLRLCGPPGAEQDVQQDVLKSVQNVVCRLPESSVTSAAGWVLCCTAPGGASSSGCGTST